MPFDYSSYNFDIAVTDYNNLNTRIAGCSMINDNEEVMLTQFDDYGNNVLTFSSSYNGS